jgi:DNA-binding LytR/AlgR family response regulator
LSAGPDGRLSVLAVDDERPQLDDLARMLRASPRVGEVTTAGSAQEALLLVSRTPYDAVFLDVRMPELDGLELARVFRAFARPPALVFVSAFDTPAATAFELRALDYLLKPITQERVEEALGRIAAGSGAGVGAAVSDARSGQSPPAARSQDRGTPEVLPVDNLRGGGTRLLPVAQILYFEAHGDYLRVYAEGGRYILRGRLADVEQRYEGHGFVRVHRRYLANLARAREVSPMLNGTAVLRFDGGAEIPVARRQVPELRRWLRA